MDTRFEYKFLNLEADHWWFRGRRGLIMTLIDALRLRPGAAIIDIGCSGGQLMSELKRSGFHSVSGIDISARSVAVCGERGLSGAFLMDATQTSFPDGTFDLAIASDVLEHIEDDRAAVAEWRRILKPGGDLIVSVPAFQSLWSEHDDANRHFRRYGRSELRRLLKDSEFTVQRVGYWNATLFPPVYAVRSLKRALLQSRTTGASDDLHSVPQPLNWMLTGILRMENLLLSLGLDYPYGVSLFALARKDEVKPEAPGATHKGPSSVPCACLAAGTLDRGPHAQGATQRPLVRGTRVISGPENCERIPRRTNGREM